jgi:hypothetical protein
VDPSSVADAIAKVPVDPVAILGVMIPIVAIVMGLGIGMLKLWLDYRKKREILQAHHAERMAAIEKGVEVPPLPSQFFGPEAQPLPPDTLQEQLKGRHIGLQYLRSGLMWLLIGIAISVALYANHDHDAHNAAWWGGVPAAFGLSKLLFYFIANRMNAAADARSDQGKPKE